MNADTLLENFEILAEAPNGVDHLKSIIFDLAVSGQLVERVASDVESPDLMPGDLKSSYLHPEIAGWFVVPLGKCAKIFNGNSTSSAEKLRLSHVAEGLPYVATKDVGYGFEPILLDTGLRVPVSKSQYKVAPDGAVLICLEGGSAGRKMGILASQVCFGNKLFANVCRPWLDPRFLLICLLSNSFSTQFRSQLSGIIGGISKAKYSELSIPVPPLAEQKRIVAKVDELMTLCDKLEQQQKQRDNLRTATRKSAINAISTATTPEELEAAWKRINNNWELIADTPESIASLRSLILDLAVRGSLNSSEVDPHQVPINVQLENLKLDEDKLWKLATALPEPAQGWSRVPMARLGKWGSGGTPTASRKEYYQNGTIPWAVIGDLNNSVLLKTESSITKKALESSSTKMIPSGAVLVAMYGASIGKSAVSGIECCTNQAIAHCVVDSDVIIREYMFLVIKSLKNHLIDMGKGAAQPNISQSVLKHLVIDIPPLNIQKKVIEQTDELLDLCNQIEITLSHRRYLEELIAKTITRTVAA